jgi:hypothetical protein
LLDEQNYHRESLQQHNFHLHGYGIVHGLQVEFQSKKKGYLVTIQAGFGIAKNGCGVNVPTNVECMLDKPSADGLYILWLVLLETEDEKDMRQVFDTAEQRPARIIEGVAVKLQPESDDFEHGVQLRRVQCRMGRMSPLNDPVPRAGRTERAAESYLKPKLNSFIEINRQIINLLYRTTEVREIEMDTISFNSALISAEFLLIEEGTSDRVLYRTAGSLMRYSNQFYNSMHRKIEALESIRDNMRRISNQIPNPLQSSDVWRKWFGSFQRLISPLEDAAKSLEETIGPQQ